MNKILAGRVSRIHWFSLIAVGGFLFLTGLACNFPIQLFADKQSEDLATAVAAEKVDDRPEVIAELGLPDAFDIAIVQVEGMQVRMESWRYYQYATRVDFVDGEAVWTVEIEPMPDGTLFAAWYNPLDFEAGMSAEEASQQASAASPASTRLERIDLSPGGEEFEDSWILVGDQIIVGVDETGLVYVETVALVPEGGE